MTDKINKRRFLLNRFLRIFPVLLVYVLYRVICHSDYSALYDLVFINNLIGPKSHIWSVAVEFQFYLISPFLVKAMKNSQNPCLYPISMFMFSGMLSYLIMISKCPEVENNLNEWKKEYCLDVFWHAIYNKTYCRMTPYGFGIYASLCSKNDEMKKLGDTFKWVFEIVSVLIITAIIFIGAMPEMYPLFNSEIWLLNIIWSRQIFGVCLSFLVY